jgi:hypothetical protein
MSRLYHKWLRSAGAKVDDSIPVEISPLFALDAADVGAKIRPGLTLTEPTFLK